MALSDTLTRALSVGSSQSFLGLDHTSKHIATSNNDGFKVFLILIVSSAQDQDLDADARNSQAAEEIIIK